MSLGRSSGRSSALPLGRRSGCEVGRVCGCGDTSLARCEAGWLSCGSDCLRARSQTGMRSCRVCGMTGGGLVVFAPLRQASQAAYLSCGRRSCWRVGWVYDLSAVGPANQKALWQARWTGSRPGALLVRRPLNRLGTRPLGRTTCRMDCRPASRTTLFLASMLACQVSSGHDYRRCEFQGRGGEVHSRR